MSIKLSPTFTNVPLFTISVYSVVMETAKMLGTTGKVMEGKTDGEGCREKCPKVAYRLKVGNDNCVCVCVRRQGPSLRPKNFRAILHNPVQQTHVRLVDVVPVSRHIMHIDLLLSPDLLLSFSLTLSL